MPYDPFAVAPTGTMTTTSIGTPAATSGLAATNALAPVMAQPQNRTDRKLAMGQFKDARHDWLSSLMAAHRAGGQDWRTLLDARPQRQDYWDHGQFGEAYTAPGSAPPASIAVGEPNPGAPGFVPPQMLPPMPGSIGVNPVATPGGGVTGAPLMANDWRTLVQNRGGYRF